LYFSLYFLSKFDILFFFIHIFVTQTYSRTSGDERTIIFGLTTSEHCSEMCKASYLSDNSCDHGLSCTAKSECIKSVKSSCNCSINFKCKDGDQSPSDSSHSDDSTSDDNSNLDKKHNDNPNSDNPNSDDTDSGKKHSDDSDSDTKPSEDSDSDPTPSDTSVSDITDSDISDNKDLDNSDSDKSQRSSQKLSSTSYSHSKYRLDILPISFCYK
jgi:hypothetical protein